MRTATFETSGSISYPEEVAFAFNPMVIKVTTANEVTFTITADDVTFVDKRQSYKNIVFIDIAQYVQTIFKHDEGMITSKVVNITVVTTADTFTFKLNAIWGAMNIAEVFNGSRKVTWFKKFPFTFSMYVPSESIVRTRYDKNKYTNKTLSAGLQHITPSTLFNPSEFGVIRMDETIHPSTFEYTFDGTFRAVADGTIINRLVVDNRDCGIYLRWIDRHGFYQYYLFDKGEGTENSKNEGEKIKQEWNDGSNYYNGVGRYAHKNVEHTVKVCAVMIDEDTFKMLKTVCSSPLVDMYAGNDIWVPIVIKDTAAVSSSEHLRDFEIEIVLPTIQTQKL